MTFVEYWTKAATEEFIRLDVGVQKRIKSKLSFWCKQPNLLHFAKKLTNPKIGSYRFRIGDYRVLFELDTDGRVIILVILRVKHRREAYD